MLLHLPQLSLIQFLLKGLDLVLSIGKMHIQTRVLRQMVNHNLLKILSHFINLFEFYF